MTDIEQTRHLVRTVAPDRFGEMLIVLDGMGQAIQSVKAELESRMIETIIETGQDIVIGDVRYYVGRPKTTKCIDVGGAVQALMEASGGDMDVFVSCLASDAIKHGAASKMLSPDVYEALFETTYPQKLQKGKPSGRLMRADPKFIKVSNGQKG